MGCLTDVELQSLVDDEATEASRQHAMACASCQQRIDELRVQMRAIADAVNATGDVPTALEVRLRQSLASASAGSAVRGSGVRGSTVLRERPSRSAPRWHGTRWLYAGSIAAAVAVVVFAVLPRLGAPTRLSAAQVLQRSLQTLSAGTGVESLEYELDVDGVADGPFRIEHLIDRANPQHYRVASFGPDGLLRTAISQDPVERRRTQAIRVDGRTYIVTVPDIREPVLSLPQMGQALLESVITMMQATADPTLTMQDGPAGREYVVETPQIATTNAATTLDLSHARAVIGADDFRIHEFEASGALLRQPFAVSIRLIRQEVVESTSANFAIDPAPGDVVLDGQAGDGPLEELLTAIVRGAN
jgi:hypothetical protein